MDHHHKRSKSQKARSLLSRVSSKTDDTRDEDSADNSIPPSRTSNVGSEASSAASQSTANLQARLHHSSSQRSAHHRPHLSAPSGHRSAENVSTHAAPTSNPHNSNPPSPTANTLEQSVKLFRLFEALRNGDTAAISKAIREQSSSDGSGGVEGTTLLHLAIQCAELPVIEFVLSNVISSHDPSRGINARDRDGNAPIHIAARLGRAPVVKLLLEQDGINDALTNYSGQSPLDLAVVPEIFQQLQLARSLYIDKNVRKIHELVARKDYEGLEKLFTDERVRSTIDIDGEELPTDEATTQSGGTLLHEAARKRDHKLIQLLLLNGADPFKRDRKGHLPQNVTKDERTKAILKKSPAAAAAQRGIQEKTILGGGSAQGNGGPAGDGILNNKESREMKGYLKKWTNYTSGWKLRWFVLEDGVLSYYKHQDDAGTACRGAINMKIAKLNMDPQDKLRFEIHGKSSVKYHLRANHQVEAKRWYWALNNAIQWSKDEAREEERKSKAENDALRHAKIEQHRPDDSGSVSSQPTRSFYPSSSLGVPLTSANASTSAIEDDDPANASAYEPSVAGAEMGRLVHQLGTTTIEGDLDEGEEYGDDASSHEVKPASRDAFNITAQSVRLQLDLLAQVSASLQREKEKNPSLSISDPLTVQALSAYDSAVGNIKSLVGDILRISKDRDAYWQYRLEREANIRRMWEESMAKVAYEQEQLENKMGESEVKRKRTKRALRDALENLAEAESKPATPDHEKQFAETAGEKEAPTMSSPGRRKSTFVDLTGLSEDESDDDDEEFFDAIGTGEVEVVEMPVVSSGLKPVEKAPALDIRERKLAEIQPSFRGYEKGVRKRLKMDADDRPKISLWSILKSMIGKDMTKMTLPVSFNEPTSLLQRVAEDMEYTDLLDVAAERLDSCERMVYVAAFAASEYASTIGRVAKPFNPLLAETYEYARPDKGYRFFIEQVSHHPPVGAAWAESPKWDYYGESAVRSKFYGRSFDINPLGTWFLKLRHAGGGEELYTWKKVTSSVINIITGNPTVDNYGVMEIKNWTTGEVCTLDFKPRGWRASSAYQVVGRVTDTDGNTRWSIGGRWNDKIYARLTPGWEDDALSPTHPSYSQLSRQDTTTMNSTRAFLVWQANARPTGIPFNLTPFVLTLNDINPDLEPVIAPTDTRLRPDQRAMEDGVYDFAATEKNRLEEKQRARRRWREQRGEDFVPRWFKKAKCEITGEEFWRSSGEYWRHRREVADNGARWEEAGLEDIFSNNGWNEKAGRYEFD